MKHTQLYKIVEHTLPSKTLFLTLLSVMLIGIVSVDIVAQQTDIQDISAIESRECELTRKVFGYPYYYCDCIEDNTVDFRFGMDMEIRDTLWFAATVAELKQGLSAYWFSTKGIRLELYALCSSTAPTMVLTVGGNTMKEMDIAFINKKLDEMGALSEIAETVMKPHLRVYPLNGGEGRVLAFPYDEGPHSTCGDLLPIVPGMTYVSSSDEDVYALPAKTIRKDQQMFVQWKQKNNNTCEMTITRGTCDGEPVLTRTMKDSTKLFFPDIAFMNEVKDSGDTLFFHFRHNATDAGRIVFRYNPKYEDMGVVDTIFCEGRALQLADTALTQTTLYGPDTVWFRNDTLRIYSYNVSVISSDLQYDTLTLYQKQLPFYYRNLYYINRMGSHDVVLHRDGLCDEKVKLEIYHRIDTVSVEKQTEQCQGKTLEINKTTFKADTTLYYDEWADADTWQHVAHNLLFIEPELEYDTVYVLKTELPYYYQTANKYVRSFGEQTFTITARNKCTRLIQLTVIEIQPTDFAVPYEESKPRKILKDGHIYILIDGKYKTLLGQEL